MDVDLPLPMSTAVTANYEDDVDHEDDRWRLPASLLAAVGFNSWISVVVTTKVLASGASKSSGIVFEGCRSQLGRKPPTSPSL